jgi:hypothetical protein
LLRSAMRGNLSVRSHTGTWWSSIDPIVPPFFVRETEKNKQFCLCRLAVKFVVYYEACRRRQTRRTDFSRKQPHWADSPKHSWPMSMTNAIRDDQNRR